MMHGLLNAFSQKLLHVLQNSLLIIYSSPKHLFGVHRHLCFYKDQLVTLRSNAFSCCYKQALRLTVLPQSSHTGSVYIDLKKVVSSLLKGSIAPHKKKTAEQCEQRYLSICKFYSFIMACHLFHQFYFLNHSIFLVTIS